MKAILGILQFILILFVLSLFAGNSNEITKIIMLFAAMPVAGVLITILFVFPGIHKYNKRIARILKIAEAERAYMTEREKEIFDQKLTALQYIKKESIYYYEQSAKNLFEYVKAVRNARIKGKRKPLRMRRRYR
ncbi:MAG: hypothetical protein NC388_10425 [Clostridium sp.]|nr:hypothetical protein [Clostridium sp.]